MQLINKKTNQVLVEFKEDQTIFHSKFLEHEMEQLGIMIPHGLRALYDGRDCVYLGQEDFQKAFREIYYLTMMNSDHFQWKS